MKVQLFLESGIRESFKKPRSMSAESLKLCEH